MKIINKLFVLSSLLLVTLLSACDTDQEGAIYNNTDQKVSFASSTLSLENDLLNYDEPTFTVDVYRSNTKGELKGSVTAEALDPQKGNPLEGVTPQVSDYNFKDGEDKASITVDISTLPGGSEATIILTVAKDAANDFSNASAKVDVSRDYKWIQLGKGTFKDSYLAAGHTYSVDIIQASDGKENRPLYRVNDPYKEMIANKDYDTNKYKATGEESSYIELQPLRVGGENIAYFSTTDTGIGLIAGEKVAPITIAHPYALGYIQSMWVNNKFLDNKTIQLAPVYNSTGFDKDADNDQTGNANGTILITLP